MNKMPMELTRAQWVECMSLPGMGYTRICYLMESYVNQEPKGNYDGFLDWLRSGAYRKANLQPRVCPQSVMERLVRGLEALPKYREELKKTEERGIRVITLADAAYPDSFRYLADPPPILYVIGKLPNEVDIKSTIAMVGARLCSEYGRYVARNYGAFFGEHGIGVISGMADGIDAISQNAAMLRGGYSLGILGCGVDICYPTSNRALYERLIHEGGVMSEVPPGTEPKKGYFPLRNRLISALADAVLIVEARKRSGTLITADCALEQGKDVFAVPGRLNEALSAGCNRLIYQGAGIALSPEQVLEDLYGRGKEDSETYEQLSFETEEADFLAEDVCVPPKTLAVLIEEALSLVPKNPEELYREVIPLAPEDTTFPMFIRELQKLVLDGTAARVAGNYIRRSQT